MPRELTPEQASAMSKAREKNAGGRKKKPTACPKCGAICPGARLAMVHCSS